MMCRRSDESPGEIPDQLNIQTTCVRRILYLHPVFLAVGRDSDRAGQTKPVGEAGGKEELAGNDRSFSDRPYCYGLFVVLSTSSTSTC